jgi:hypothetical protein
MHPTMRRTTRDDEIDDLAEGAFLLHAVARREGVVNRCTLDDLHDPEHVLTATAIGEWISPDSEEEIAI